MVVEAELVFTSFVPLGGSAETPRERTSNSFVDISLDVFVEVELALTSFVPLGGSTETPGERTHSLADNIVSLKQILTEELSFNFSFDGVFFILFLIMFSLFGVFQVLVFVVDVIDCSAIEDVVVGVNCFFCTI